MATVYAPRAPLPEASADNMSKEAFMATQPSIPAETAPSAEPEPIAAQPGKVQAFFANSERRLPRPTWEDEVYISWDDDSGVILHS